MSEEFQATIRAVEESCKALVAMNPVDRGRLPLQMPASGVYTFLEGGAVLYVGRSDRMRMRILEHGRAASSCNVAALAFRLAREATGTTNPTYRREGSRAFLEQQPAFHLAFLAAKERVRAMQVRWVEEADPVRQALLEIYAAVTLRARYNGFINT